MTLIHTGCEVEGAGDVEGAVVGGCHSAVQEAAVKVACAVRGYRVVHVEVHGVVRLDTEQLLKRLYDKDDGNQGGEALLCEPGDVLHQGTQVEDYNE